MTNNNNGLIKRKAFMPRGCCCCTSLLSMDIRKWITSHDDVYLFHRQGMTYYSPQLNHFIMYTFHLTNNVKIGI